MGDPVGASAHVRQALAPNGTWMIVEPFANDRLEVNFNAVARNYYCASTIIGTLASRAQESAVCLGAQEGQARSREIVTRAGFTDFRCATQRRSI